MKLFFATHQGAREYQEDNFIVDEHAKLFAVCDGMGGHPGGAIASKIACQSIQTYVQSGELDGLDVTQEAALTNAFSEAQQAIMREAYEIAERKGREWLLMSTTASALILGKGSASACSIGDSLLCMFDSQSGELSWQNEQGPNRRGGVAGLGGATGDYDPKTEIGSVEFFDWDRFLLCTDGVTSFLSDEKICQIMQHPILKEAGNALMRESLKAGGRRADNVTVILVEITPKSDVMKRALGIEQLEGSPWVERAESRKEGAKPRPTTQATTEPSEDRPRRKRPGGQKPKKRKRLPPKK